MVVLIAIFYITLTAVMMTFEWLSKFWPVEMRHEPPVRDYAHVPWQRSVCNFVSNVCAFIIIVSIALLLLFL